METLLLANSTKNIGAGTRSVPGKVNNLVYGGKFTVSKISSFLKLPILMSDIVLHIYSGHLHPLTCL